MRLWRWRNLTLVAVILLVTVQSGCGVYSASPGRVDDNIKRVAFRLELHTGVNGSEQIRWHGTVDGQQRTFKVDPLTGFWRRFGIGFMRILPIESLL